MKKILEAQNRLSEPIEIVIILGTPPIQWASEWGKRSGQDALNVYNARVVYYDRLLQDAEEAYKDYLEKRKLKDKLGAMFQAIDDYAPIEAA